MKLSRVGIDLAKNVYQLHGVDCFGETIWTRRLKRHQWLKVLLDKTDTDCVIGMEAYGGAHHTIRVCFIQQYLDAIIADGPSLALSDS